MVVFAVGDEGGGVDEGEGLGVVFEVERAVEDVVDDGPVGDFGEEEVDLGVGEGWGAGGEDFAFHLAEFGGHGGAFRKECEGFGGIILCGGGEGMSRCERNGFISSEGFWMRYVLKQNLWSIAHNYSITDEYGAEAFRVQGKVFSWGDKLSLLDPAGNEVVYIEQKVLAWGPTYQLYSGGQLVAVVKEELFTFFHTTFDVDAAPIGPSGNDMTATGDVMSWEYTFTHWRGGGGAGCRRSFFQMTDTYGVEISEGRGCGVGASGGDYLLLIGVRQRKRERR